MNIIQRLQELPSHQYAVAGVAAVIVLFILLKLGLGLMKKVDFLGIFAVLALGVLLALQH